MGSSLKSLPTEQILIAAAFTPVTKSNAGNAKAPGAGPPSSARSKSAITSKPAPPATAQA
jgi:hypothetical protein